jgi:hypothetical protein
MDFSAAHNEASTGLFLAEVGDLIAGRLNRGRPSVSNQPYSPIRTTLTLMPTIPQTPGLVAHTVMMNMRNPVTLLLKSSRILQRSVIPKVGRPAIPPRSQIPRTLVGSLIEADQQVLRGVLEKLIRWLRWPPWHRMDNSDR